MIKREDLIAQRDCGMQIIKGTIYHSEEDLINSHLEAIDKIEDLEAYLSGIKKGMELRRIAEGK